MLLLIKQSTGAQPLGVDTHPWCWFHTEVDGQWDASGAWQQMVPFTLCKQHICNNVVGIFLYTSRNSIYHQRRYLFDYYLPPPE